MRDIRSVPQTWHQIFLRVVTLYTEAVQVTNGNASAVCNLVAKHLARGWWETGSNPMAVPGAINNALFLSIYTRCPSRYMSTTRHVP